MAQVIAQEVFTVPGPSPAPVYGRLAHTLRFAHDAIGYPRQLFQTYGRVVALAAGGKTRLYSPLPHCPGTVFAYGPDIVRQVTSQHDIFFKYPLTMGLYPENPTPRTAPLRHLGVGLFGVNSSEHREHRRLLMPAFHKKRIESYRDTMVAITQQELDQWQPGEQRDIAATTRALTMRVAVKTLFGEEVDEQLRSTGHLLFDTFGLLGLPLTTLLPYDLPGLPYRRFLNKAAQLDTRLRDIITRKRASGSDDGSMLSMLIEARYEGSGDALTDDELLGHTGVIFIAGHETSSTALTWTLFLLSQHPQIASDLLDELDGVLHGDAPTVEQLAKLPLLERVVKESMRVISPVPYNARVTSQPTEVGGHPLPTGTEVWVSIYETHHMPDIYPQPERFDPRRWETIIPTIFEYNPFSAGPRMCIGATFAMMEIKLVLAMLLQRYRMQYMTNVPVEREGVIVVGPKNGMPMRVNTQDRQLARGVGGVQGNIREMVELP